jgi:DNA-binding winged helix-turn-helix (wHTH) protein/tetratricopeptide (TPR) repeat protein
MGHPDPVTRHVRFGLFEVDVQSGELRRRGVKVKLQEQPFHVLMMLLDCPGKVITREEIQKRLWPANTFVDFDRGLNRAMNRLRDALDDNADSPRFVETLPRRGYRFIAPVVRPEIYSGAAPDKQELVTIRRLLTTSPEEGCRSTIEARADPVALAAAPSGAVSDHRTPRLIPLIGHDHERSELLGLLDAAMAGRGSLALITGEPGIGKTHLTRAILAEAGRRGCFRVVGHCYEMEGSPPYVPFIEALEYSARALPRDAFRYALGDGAPELAKLMPELRRMYSDIASPLELPPEQQRRFLFNAYNEFVDRTAHVAPFIAVFEDLHWADEPSLLLLQHLANSVSAIPALLIGTYREIELERRRPFARALENFLRRTAARIPLRRLPISGVGAMLRALSEQTPAASLTKIIFDKAEGNPFFVEELFRHLAEEGKLFDEEGAWRQGVRADEVQVPESVRRVIERRFERLGEETRSVLTTAAVIGRSFSLQLLENVENAQPDAALKAVEEAERAHLVSAEHAGRETRYRFSHELIRQTLAEILSLPRRQRMHARIAGAIERTYGDNLDSHASSLAHHLCQAGAAADPEETLKYLRIAAKLASAAAAHEEALAHLDNALSLIEGERNPHAAELHASRAVALRSISRFDEAVDSYEHAIALFVQAGNLRAAAEASFHLAVMHGWNADGARAVRAVDDALRLIGAERSPLTFRLLLYKALCLSFYDVEAGLGMLAEAKLMAASLPGTGVDGRAKADEGRLYWNAARLECADQCAREAIARFRAAGDLWGEADVWEPIATSLYMGRPTEIEVPIRDSVKRAERVGHQNAVWLCKNFSAEMYVALGNLEQAELAAHESFKLGESLSIGWLFLDAIVLGYIAQYRGRSDEAAQWFRHGIEIERQSHWSGILAGGLFWALGMKGDPAATEALAKAYPHLPIPGRVLRLGACGCLAFVVEGLAWLGRHDEAAALQSHTEHVIANGPWCVYGLYLLRTSAGIAAACRHDWSRAEEHHQTAIRQADTAPYRVAQPIARHWYAEMLLARGATGDKANARALLNEALAMFELLGMPGYRRRTSERLVSLNP